MIGEIKAPDDEVLKYDDNYIVTLWLLIAHSALSLKAEAPKADAKK